MFDQSKNPNFVVFAGGRRRPAARDGVDRTGGLRQDAAGRQEQHPAAHRRACSTCAATARTSSARGWGIYTDFGYTNSNGLFAAADATGSGFGNVFNANGHARHEESGRQLLSGRAAADQPREPEPGRSRAFPLFGQFVDPRLQQPEQRQTNARLVARAVERHGRVSADYINSLGRDLNFRPRVNQRIPGTTAAPVRALWSPAHARTPTRTRPAVSRGKSHYNALILCAAPADVARHRLHRVVHAVEGHQQHRHRLRRAEHREHPGCEQPVR